MLVVEAAAPRGDRAEHVVTGNAVGVHARGDVQSVDVQVRLVAGMAEEIRRGSGRERVLEVQPEHVAPPCLDHRGDESATIGEKRGRGAPKVARAGLRLDGHVEDVAVSRRRRCGRVGEYGSGRPGWAGHSGRTRWASRASRTGRASGAARRARRHVVIPAHHAAARHGPARAHAPTHPSAHARHPRAAEPVHLGGAHPHVIREVLHRGEMLIDLGAICGHVRDTADHRHVASQFHRHGPCAALDVCVRGPAHRPERGVHLAGDPVHLVDDGLHLIGVALGRRRAIGDGAQRRSARLEGGGRRGDALRCLVEGVGSGVGSRVGSGVVHAGGATGGECHGEGNG